LLTETPTVSTLLPISFAPLLALVLTVTNDSADMPTASYLRQRSARLLTGMLAVSTFFSLRRVLFLVLTVIILSIKPCHFIPDKGARRKRHS
jgi:hypothetical protein